MRCKSIERIFETGTFVFYLTVGILVLISFYGVAAATDNPVPHIDQPLFPDAVVPGRLGFVFTVKGTGFVSGSEIEWNGSARATNFVSSTRLTASIPTPDVAKAGTASVTVFNPAPGGGSSNVVFFPIISPTPFVLFNRLDFATGNRPFSVATGDFNRDGSLDLAIVNFCPPCDHGSVSILLGNGDGSFQTHVDYPVSGFPQSLITGDFNGDGKLDLAVGNSILLGNGDGTFQVPVDHAFGESGTLAAGDFNGDGKLDLAISTAAVSGTGVAILLGNGDGTFQAPVVYPASSGNLFGDLTTGDFNGDGKLDLATIVCTPGCVARGVSILLGNGDGTFRAPAFYPTSTGASALTTGDFNRDRKLDLAVANSSSVSILLGNGDGTFRTPVNYATPGGPSSVTAADFNGHGQLDLALTNFVGHTVSILLGNGDGTFQHHKDFVVGSAPVAVTAGDFNDDGGLDLAVVNDFEATVSVLLQTPNIALEPNFPIFGEQRVGTTSPAQKVRIKNYGPGTLTISGFTKIGDFDATNGCGPSVAAGSACTIYVTFTPTATGTRTGLITLIDNAPKSETKITPTGTGIP
jgi:FG-GAP-like repeat